MKNNHSANTTQQQGMFGVSRAERLLILVYGSRRIHAENMVDLAIMSALEGWNLRPCDVRFVLPEKVEGACTLAREWAERRDVPCTLYATTEDTARGRALRNRAMVSRCSLGLFLVFDGPHSERRGPWDVWNVRTRRVWESFRRARCADSAQVWVCDEARDPSRASLILSREWPA